MAKVRTKKEHKKRVAKRRNLINQEKKRFEKAQKNYIMKLIEEENKKGLFDGPTNPILNSIPAVPSIADPNLIPTPDLGFSGPKI